MAGCIFLFSLNVFMQCSFSDMFHHVVYSVYKKYLILCLYNIDARRITFFTLIKKHNIKCESKNKSRQIDLNDVQIWMNI